MNRRDFQKLAELRLKDAQALLGARRPSGAYYLAGYAVECALKACICKKVKAGDWPVKPDDVRKMYSHDLNELFRQADLLNQREAEIRSNAVFAVNWNTVKDWSEQSRYDVHTISDARNLLMEVSDATNGVLLWVQRYW
jgi:HEPN domain-containing protein